MFARKRYDLTDPAFLEDPAPMLAAMRAEGPLVRARLPLMGRVWLTATAEATRGLLKADDRFCREPANAGRRSGPLFMRLLPRWTRPMMQNMVIRDDPDHRRLRRLVELAFARGSVEAMRPAIAAEADRLLDRLDPAQPVEIVGAYARELPLVVICDLLGLDEAGRRAVVPHLARLSRLRGPISILRGLGGLRRVMDHVREEIARRRADPRPGLIAALIAAEAEGDRLSEDELLAMVMTLFVAGHETTVHLIAGSIVALIDWPDQRARLMAEPAIAPLAVEELLRYVSPILASKPHYVREDVEFMGVRLRRGEIAMACLAAGNFDPALYDAPGELRLDRRPNAHLSFGAGVHACLGMQLARAETEVALGRLFARYPDLALAGPRDDLRHMRRLGLRGYERLELRLSP